MCFIVIIHFQKCIVQYGSAESICFVANVSIIYSCFMVTQNSYVLYPMCPSSTPALWLCRIHMSCIQCVYHLLLLYGYTEFICLVSNVSIIYSCLMVTQNPYVLSPMCLSSTPALWLCRIHMSCLQCVHHLLLLYGYAESICLVSNVSIIYYCFMVRQIPYVLSLMCPSSTPALWFC